MAGLRIGRGAAGYADRLELRRRLGIGLLLQPVRDPDARGRPLDRLGLLVDDEERDTIPPRPVVGGAGDDGDVLARSTPQRLQGPWRRCGRRSRPTVVLLPEPPQAARASAQPSAMRAAAGRITARV